MSERAAQTLRRGAPWRPVAVVLWLVVLVGMPAYVAFGGKYSLIDLEVYRVGGQTWLHGLSLYSAEFPRPLDGPLLPFTYPPLAAVLFSLFSIMPTGLAWYTFTFLGLVALSATCVVTARALWARWPEATSAGLLVAAVGVYLFEPVKETLGFGQINLLMMGLVAVDCLLPKTKWPRGLLIGFAAAIKLTPAVFILYFLAKRQWRPAITMVVSFVGFGLLGLLLDAKDTKEYWFVSLLDPKRIGGLAYASNQSIHGVLDRMVVGGTALRGTTTESVIWALCSLGVVILAWIGVRKARQGGDDVTGMLVIATTGLLASPVSWSHHWVWIVPAVLLLGYAAWQSMKPLAYAGFVVLVAIFATGPHWWFPREQDRELLWPWWQHIIGNTYVLCGLLFLVVVAVRGPLLRFRDTVAA